MHVSVLVQSCVFSDASFLLTVSLHLLGGVADGTSLIIIMARETLSAKPRCCITGSSLHTYSLVFLVVFKISLERFF